MKCYGNVYVNSDDLYLLFVVSFDVKIDEDKHDKFQKIKENVENHWRDFQKDLPDSDSQFVSYLNSNKLLGDYDIIFASNTFTMVLQ